MPIQTEQTDLESLRRLEPQEISAVFDRYYPEVFRFVHYRLTDEPAAEDIASEVFVRLLESLKNWPGTSYQSQGLAASNRFPSHHRLSEKKISPD